MLHSMPVVSALSGRHATPIHSLIGISLSNSWFPATGLVAQMSSKQQKQHRGWSSHASHPWFTVVCSQGPIKRKFYSHPVVFEINQLVLPLWQVQWLKQHCSRVHISPLSGMPKESSCTRVDDDLAVAGKKQARQSQNQNCPCCTLGGCKPPELVALQKFHCQLHPRNIASNLLQPPGAFAFDIHSIYWCNGQLLKPIQVQWEFHHNRGWLARPLVEILDSPAISKHIVPRPCHAQCDSGGSPRFRTARSQVPHHGGAVLLRRSNRPALKVQSVAFAALYKKMATTSEPGSK